MVKRAWEYRWSSAAYHVGLVERDPVFNGRNLYRLVGAKDWRMLLAREPEESAAVRRATCTGRPCGDQRFLRRAEKLTGCRLHPLKPGHYACRAGDVTKCVEADKRGCISFEMEVCQPPTRLEITPLRNKCS